MQDAARAQSTPSRLSQDHAQSWKIVFIFTSRAHLLVLFPAILLSAVAGLLQPLVAIFFGKILETFSEFAGGQIDGSILMRRILENVYALLGIGCCTLVLKGGQLALWLMFGEMQAQAVREELFESLLEKDVEWYESRATGVTTLLTRLQTYGTLP